MKKLKNSLWDIGVFLVAITFNPITLVILILIGAVGCTSQTKKYRENNNHNIIWRVAYVDSSSRIKDYIYSTSEDGCKCSYQPFEFHSQYFEMMNPTDDSVAAVNRFRKTFPNTSYMVYEAYPYCKVKDWATQETFEEKNRITKRETLIDTWIVCQKLGLIDDEGQYINVLKNPYLLSTNR